MKDLKAFIAEERRFAAAIDLMGNAVEAAAMRMLLGRLEQYLAAEPEPGRFVPHWIPGGTVVHLVDTHTPSLSLCGRWVDRDAIGAVGAPPGLRQCRPCGRVYALMTG